MNPQQIAEVISKEIDARLGGMVDSAYLRGVITAVDGATCSVKIEGATTAMVGIPTIGSYKAIVDDQVLVINIGRTGANFVVIGGTQGALNSIVRNEVPSGTVNSSNKVFTLANNPLTGSLAVHRNGIRLKETNDYTLSGDTITFVTAPTTGAIILCDYAVATSEGIAGTDSIVSGETPTGLVNGTNKVFTVLGNKYASGSLEVWVNGLFQKRVTHFTENDADDGEFTFIDAPQTDDIIQCSYQYAHVASGNADMVDGKHASEFALLTATQTFANSTFESEDWHEVGDGGEPAYQNGWVEYNATEYGGASFYKDASGVVYLRGLVKSGTVNTTIFTLPTGYRPEMRLLCSVQSGSNTTGYRLDVMQTGEVKQLSGSNTWISLANVSFRGI